MQNVMNIWRGREEKIVVIVSISVLAFIGGVRQGLIGELAGVVALVLGLYGAARFCPLTEELISPYLGGQPTSLVAFCVTLVAIIFVVGLVSSIITRILSSSIVLSIPNRILGGIFSSLKVLVIVSCIIGAVERLWPGNGMISEQEKDELVTYRFVESLSSYVFPYIDKCVDKISEVAEAAGNQP